MLRMPGLIDPHVHMREPGATHKEDWGSGTASALAGGFTIVLAMPNTTPPVCDVDSFRKTLHLAASKAYCDYAQFTGAGAENVSSIARLARVSAGLKMYLDQTYGPLQLKDFKTIEKHFQHWPSDAPLCLHCEGETLKKAVTLAETLRRPIHVCHVSRRNEILFIRAAKERGAAVTCEVTPHHLFLCDEDLPALGAGLCEVRPRLASRADQQALWHNLEVIDCFASDHAPHTLSEKTSVNPPPGFPGIETALPLYLTAVHEGRLTLQDIITRCHDAPQKIFHLTEQPETWIEVDEDFAWQIHAVDLHSRSAWTPYEGRPVRGIVRRVVLRGKEVYRDGSIAVEPGYGINLRPVLSDDIQLSGGIL